MCSSYFSLPATICPLRPLLWSTSTLQLGAPATIRFPPSSNSSVRVSSVRRFVLSLAICRPVSRPSIRAPVAGVSFTALHALLYSPATSPSTIVPAMYQQPFTASHTRIRSQFCRRSGRGRVHPSPLLPYAHQRSSTHAPISLLLSSRPRHGHTWSRYADRYSRGGRQRIRGKMEGVAEEAEDDVAADGRRGWAAGFPRYVFRNAQWWVG
ncbi:hypothetical protein C8Q77DRAFT_199593 [Trametes polyzona]|nr:hypothetical protein C8Q77DRAFT_199593 [Trametes polyzona]